MIQDHLCHHVRICQKQLVPPDVCHEDPKMAIIDGKWKPVQQLLQPDAGIVELSHDITAVQASTCR